jgi:hypothetical protein
MGAVGVVMGAVDGWKMFEEHFIPVQYWEGAVDGWKMFEELYFQKYRHFDLSCS